jgi:hypothetical protein
MRKLREPDFARERRISPRKIASVHLASGSWSLWDVKYFPNAFGKGRGELSRTVYSRKRLMRETEPSSPSHPEFDNKTGCLQEVVLVHDI